MQHKPDFSRPLERKEEMLYLKMRGLCFQQMEYLFNCQESGFILVFFCPFQKNGLKNIFS